MDSLNPDEDEQPSSLASTRSTTIFALAIVAVQILLAIISYPFLPDQVPSHWNASGQIDGYMPKLLNALFLPGLGLFFVFILRPLVAAGPSLGKANRQTTVFFMNRLLPALMLLALIIQVVTIAVALGYHVDVIFIINLFLGFLFIIIGNNLGKLRRNFWAGIRTPWTLADDTTWERTHRLGGWLFFAAGVLTIIASFLPGWGIFIGVGAILLASAFLVLYSYLVYRQLGRGGDTPLSPPFNGQS